MHTLHPHTLHPRQATGRVLQDQGQREPNPAPRRQLQGPAPRPRAARLTSAGTWQRRCRELPGEEMLRTGEDESRPPKREQDGSEMVPAAGAALSLPSPWHLSTTRRSSKQAAPLGWAESGVRGGGWGGGVLLPARLRGAHAAGMRVPSSQDPHCFKKRRWKCLHVDPEL